MLKGQEGYAWRKYVQQNKCNKIITKWGGVEENEKRIVSKRCRHKMRESRRGQKWIKHSHPEPS